MATSATAACSPRMSPRSRRATGCTSGATASCFGWRSAASRPGQGTHAPVTTSLYAGNICSREADFPRAVVSERLSLALPLYPQMTNADQELVVQELLDAFEAA